MASIEYTIHDLGSKVLPQTPQRTAIIQIKKNQNADYSNLLMKLVHEAISDYNCDILVLPEYSTNWEIENKIRDLIADCGRDIIVCAGSYLYQKKNRAPIIIQKKGKQEVFYQEKCFLSKEERGRVSPGNERHIFVNTGMGDFAVLICYEVTGDELKYLKGFIDILVVIAHNASDGKFINKFADYTTEAYLAIVYANQPETKVFSKETKGGLSAFYLPAHFREKRRLLPLKTKETGLRVLPINLFKIEEGRKQSQKVYHDVPPDSSILLASIDEGIKPHYSTPRDRKYWVHLQNSKAALVSNLLDIIIYEHRSNGTIGYSIKWTPVIIGKYGQIVPKCKGLSREHVKITVENNQVYLKDLHSKYGTEIIKGNETIQAKPNEKYRLSDGVIIVIAKKCRLTLAMSQRKSEVSNITSVPKSDKTSIAHSTHQTSVIQKEQKISADIIWTSWDKEVKQEWQVGDILLGLYQVVGVLGEGGFGRVYKLFHRQWEIYMALKTPKLLDSANEESFFREAQTWITLGVYPYIARCYYVRKIDGFPRIFTEYVGGGTLQDWIRKNKFSNGLYSRKPVEIIGRILDIAIQIAWGLEYAHKCKIIHQDVKPGNIIFANDGTVKITDFGLAKSQNNWSMNETSELLVTTTGRTTAYCSPEQKNKEKLTLHTDIWSWGLTILEMFAGNVFWKDGCEARSALMHFVKRNPKTTLFMPDKLVDLLLQCFSADPSQRPENFADIAIQLQTMFFSIRKHHYMREKPKKTGLQANDYNNSAVSLLDLGNEQEARNYLSKAQSLDPKHWYAAYNQGLLDLRSGEVYYQILAEKLQALSVSQDNWRYWYYMAQIYMENGKRAEVFHALDQTYEKSEYSLVVLENIQQLKQKVRPFCREMYNLHELNQYISCAKISANGTNIAYVSKNILYDFNFVTRTQNIPCKNKIIISMAITDTGDIFFSDYNGTMYLASQHRQVCSVLEQNSHRTYAVAVNSTGKIGVSGDERGRIKVWDLPNAKLLLSYHSHQEQVNSLAITPDGKWVISGGRDNRIYLRQLDISNTKEITVDKFYGSVTSVAISQNGIIIAIAAGKQLHIWNRKQNHFLCKKRQQTIRIVALSPSGNLAVTGMENGIVLVWDTFTGRCLGDLPGEQNIIGLVAQDSGRITAVCSKKGITLEWLVNIDLPLANFAIARPLAGNKLFEKNKKITATLKKIDKELIDGKWKKALSLLRQINNNAEYKRMPECIEAWRKIAQYTKKGNFEEAWLRHEIKIDIHATDIALSDDGSFVIIAQGKKDIILWDLTTGSSRSFIGEQAEIIGVYIIGHRQKFASLSIDGIVKKWCIENGKNFFTTGLDRKKTARTIRTHRCKFPEINKILQFAVDLHGETMVFISSHGNVGLWRNRQPEILKSIATGTNKLHHITLNGDGKIAAIAGDNGSICLWNVIDNYPIAKKKIHRGKITAIAIDSRASCLLSSGQDRRLVKWNLATGKVTTLANNGKTDHLCFSLDGSVAISVEFYKELWVWDLNVNKCLTILKGHEEKINNIAITPTGDTVVSIDENGVLKIWWLKWSLQNKNKNKDVWKWIDLFISCKNGKITNEARVDLENILRWTGNFGFDYQRYYNLLLEMRYGRFDHNGKMISDVEKYHTIEKTQKLLLDNKINSQTQRVSGTVKRKRKQSDIPTKSRILKWIYFITQSNKPNDDVIFKKKLH